MTSEERRAERDRRYREKHREAIRARAAARHAANPEQRRGYDAAYRTRNRTKVHASSVAYEASAKGRANRRAWLNTNRDRLREYQRRWVKANPDRVQSKAQKWTEAHPGLAAARTRAWGRANPEQRRLISADRRARERGAPGLHTVQQWLEKCELFAHCCAYCGERKPLSRDHKIPLTRGGGHYIENIVPACGSCNSRKNTRTCSEYLGLMSAARAMAA